MTFPITRPRRLRATPVLRDMVRETRLTPDDSVYPMFVVHGQDVRRPIRSMPGVSQLSVDQLVVEAQEAAGLGIPAVVLFGVPAQKDAVGSENFSDSGIVQQAVRALQTALPRLIVIADVCMCEYTDHGHCGIITGEQIDNDATLDILGKAAVSYAHAGADIVAPSGMMDGMVSAIRSALDGAGYLNVSILSYAIKYASAFYGPFRDAAEGAPKFGDRKTHQMDPANAREALRAVWALWNTGCSATCPPFHGDRLSRGKDLGSLQDFQGFCHNRHMEPEDGPWSPYMRGLLFVVAGGRQLCPVQPRAELIAVGDDALRTVLAQLAGDHLRGLADGHSLGLHVGQLVGD
jgi:porphobilinogen synthase